MTHTYVVGAAVGLNSKTLPGLTFNIEASYTGCLICGAVYQSKIDRKVWQITQDEYHPFSHLLAAYSVTADRLRKTWSQNHSKLHPQWQHEQLKRSGQFCTPEAALKLTPLGVFALDATDDELPAAMLEAPRAPQDDVES